MPDFVDKTKTNNGSPEVDFKFSDNADFRFSDNSDFVFRELSTTSPWNDKVKV